MENESLAIIEKLSNIAPTAQKLLATYDAEKQAEGMFENSMADFVKSTAFVLHSWSAMHHDELDIKTLARIMCTIVQDMCQ